MVHNSYIRWVVWPDVETMDEWWREVKNMKGWGFKRLSKDFVTYDDKARYWYDATGKFSSKMLWTLMVDAGGRNNHFAVNLPRSEPISGKSFYIRSKFRPEVYWYATSAGQGVIYASSVGRTRFTLRIDGEKDEDETYMIGTDKIIITKATDPKFVVGLNNGELYLSQQSNYFVYSDLKNRFLGQGEFVAGGEERNEARVKQCDLGVGEEWELVA